MSSRSRWASLVDGSELDRVASALHDRVGVLLLDNLEQVVGSAELVAELQVRCSGLVVVATSRVRLGVTHEHEFALGALAVPRNGELDTAGVASLPSVQLYLQRAHAALPNVEFGAGEIATVGELCRRLDGLPLAIELAASRVRLFSAAMLLERIGNRLDLLSRGPRNLPERQQSLRATLDWSVQLLPRSARTLFAEASVFSGGWTLDALEAVQRGQEQPLDALESLIDASLVRGLSHEETPRFTMLETVHDFAEEQLRESGREPATRTAHADYFLSLAEEAEESIQRSGPDLRTTLDLLESEHENLRSALGWLIESGQVEGEARLCVAQQRFWRLHGHLTEGILAFESLLARSDPLTAHLRALSLMKLAKLYGTAGQWRLSSERALEALQIGTESDDGALMIDCLNELGISACESGDLRGGVDYFTRGLELAGALGDVPGGIECRANLGQAWLVLERPDLAEEMTRAAVMSVRQSGHISMLAPVTDSARGCLDGVGS